MASYASCPAVARPATTSSSPGFERARNPIGRCHLTSQPGSRPSAATPTGRRLVRRLKDAGHSEDEIFEQTVSAAVGAGLERLDAALETLR